MQDPTGNPQIEVGQIVNVLEAAYALQKSKPEPLNVGADFDVAKYHVKMTHGRSYFLKVRRDAPPAASLVVPGFLREQGIEQVVAPITTRTGRFAAEYDGYVFILYPFIEGVGWNPTLRPEQWRDLGALVGQMHRATVPASVAALVPREDFSPARRQATLGFLDEASRTTFANPVSRELAALLNEHARVLRQIVAQAERLEGLVRSRQAPFVLCHADLHGGNVITNTGGRLFLVDWDSVILAPKERDLMYIGAGVSRGWNDPRDAAPFYEGYDGAPADREGIAYYRHERICDDIAQFCADIFAESGSDADRQRMLGFVRGQFAPGDVVDMAAQSLR